MKSRKPTGKPSGKPRSSKATSGESVGGWLRGAWTLLTDGRGHDLAGVGLLILAVVAGASIYSGARSAPGSWPNTMGGVLVGGLRFLLPVVFVVLGVLLIRGPREPEIDLTDDEEPWFGSSGAPRVNPTSRIIGIVLACIVAVGVLDLLLAEGRTIDADGFDGYAGGGGLLGAAVGSIAVFGGRWVALAVLALVGVFAVSLVSGLSLRELARIGGRALAPFASVVSDWFLALFRIGGSSGSGDEDALATGTDDRNRDRGDDDQGQDETSVLAADGEGMRPARTKRSTSPKEPAVVVAGARGGEGTGDDAEQLQIDLSATPDGSVWRLPPLKLLSRSKTQEVDENSVKERGRRLEGALAEHGVETRLVGMVVGPAVTRYELELGLAVKVSKVTALQKDIAYAMATPDVRILAPIPGRRAIGVEVPNERREIVCLGDILASGEAQRASHPLEVGIGRGMSGRAVLLNLASTPHLLIAGQTGAGKSSCINSLITSIMMRSTPDQVRMILIDPKQVELGQYGRVPHLLTQVVTDPKKAANALTWAVNEMERRYTLLSEIGVRDIKGYNNLFREGELENRFPERELKHMPFILIVVDELADLMLVAAKEVEHSITRIAAKARAVGIHLVVATQRPSTDVITGLIKANIPARLAFAVSSSVDSKVVLDQVGAEKLTGMGDMLLLTNSSTPERIQGAWVEEREVVDVVRQWRRQAPQAEEGYVEEIVATTSAPGGTPGGIGGGSDDDDDLVEQAMELVVRSGLGSTSMLQRKLKVGFARAGRIMDLLEERGIVGPSEGSKARAVLMTPDELDRMIDNGEL